MHTVIVVLISAAAGFIGGWIAKGRIGAQVQALESDAKKL